MTQGQQPEALRLADELERKKWHVPACVMQAAAEELRHKHARIAELEAQLDSIGAGGVEPLRPRQCLHGISEPSGWRPIETAPKNGQCLVWCDTDDGGEVMKLQRDARGNWIYEGEPTYCHSFYINPTHWMRLPPSPSSADEGWSR